MDLVQGGVGSEVDVGAGSGDAVDVGAGGVDERV
jgi:hypothetical protein